VLVGLVVLGSLAMLDAERHEPGASIVTFGDALWWAFTMSFSNSNYLLLGLLIEKVTGLSYPAAVRRDLLPGLGARIAVQDAETPTAPLAAPYLTGTSTVPDGRFLPNRAHASVAGAAGGIAADAATVARWGYRLYGGRILDAAATVDLTTPVAPGYGLGTEILEQRWAPTGGVIGHHGGIPGYATATPLCCWSTRRPR